MRTDRTRLLFLLALSAWLAGCDAEPSALDAGAFDAATSDARPPDARPPDAQPPDAAFVADDGGDDSTDAGDAMVPDAGPVDAGPPPPNEPAVADVVVAAPGSGERPFGDPALATNGVRGGGERGGSLDVYSIAYGDHLVLSWGGRRVRNGAGIDLAVFENAFAFGAESVFMDATIVEVSIDGETWVPLPHDYSAPDERMYSNRAMHWSGFAGVTPVLLHADDNPVDPFEPSLAGGDHFDLDALATDGEAGRIRRDGFVYLRLSAARDHTNPDTGEAYPRDPVGNGPDIDGVQARYVDVP